MPAPTSPANPTSKFAFTYESGGWMPGIDSPNATYGYRQGTYSKINDVMHIAMRLVLTSKGTGVNAAAVSIIGLPYLSGGLVGFAFCSPIRFLNMTASIIDLVGEINGNTIQLSKRSTATTAWQPLTVADLSSTTDLRLSGTYFVDP